MSAAAKEALNLEVEQRHRDAKEAAARDALTDHIQVVKSLDKDGHTTRHSVSSEIETGAGRMKVESKTGVGCFVATVAFGGEDDPTVEALRHFRDYRLMRHAWGRSFVRWYYRNGPGLAAVVGRHSEYLWIVRLSLCGFARLVAKSPQVTKKSRT